MWSWNFTHRFAVCDTQSFVWQWQCIMPLGCPLVTIRSPKVQKSKGGKSSTNGSEGVLQTTRDAACGGPMNVDIFYF